MSDVATLKDERLMEAIRETDNSWKSLEKAASHAHSSLNVLRREAGRRGLMHPMPDEIAPDNPWVQTYTGRQFHPLSPKVADIEIEDIAHALAMKCRFTGHCKMFYSVAQHSLYLENSWQLEECSRNVCLWGLLHDAPEAYLPDVAGPLKPFIPGFIDIERKIMEAIAERFGLTFPCPPEVHEADLRMLATEYRDLMHQPPPVEWEHIRGVEPYAFTIRRREIACVKEDFLRRFFELTGKGP